MEERWVVTAKKADFREIGEAFGIDPVTARIIRNREIIGRESVELFLHGDQKDLHDPRKLLGITQALQILQEAIRHQKKIRVIGDYDIDGVVAAHLLITGLKRLGANADTYIPNRVEDGYGLHRHLVDRAFEEGVKLLITCDNGIAAFEEIAFAKELGMEVVVTDHHNVPYEEKEGEKRELLPPADAVINPKQQQCQYPFKELCGAAVAFKLVQALYERYALPKKEYEGFLELVAFATIGDVMDLVGENRILVREGLKQLQNPKNTGLKSLISVNDLEDKTISAYHIGFVLGPCINASGRLDTAARALELLGCQEPERARQLAGELLDINQSRKALTVEGAQLAYEMVETTSLVNDKVLVVYLPQCHESLAGIIAGRLRERYHKPAFVLTKGEGGVKGSGRSIEAYSMYDELVKCRDLLVQFGGHPMAAGLSMEEKEIVSLRKQLNEGCMLTDQDLMPKVVIDVPVPISYLNKKLIGEQSLLEPFGKANPRPLFAQKGVALVKCRVVGQKHNVVQLQLMDPEGTIMEGVYFGDGDRFVEETSTFSKIDIVYYPQIHIWQGKESLRITLQHYKKNVEGN